MAHVKGMMKIESSALEPNNRYFYEKMAGML